MVTQTKIGLQVQLPASFDQALEKTTAALKAEGFGVLTSIDVQATLREKLGVEFRRYTILGACNPPLAHRALTADLGVGLLLPCNVVVYDRGDGGSTVEAMAPLTVIGTLDPTGALRPVAEEADRRLRAALARLGVPDQEA